MAFDLPVLGFLALMAFIFAGVWYLILIAVMTRVKRWLYRGGQGGQPGRSNRMAKYR